MTALPTQTVFTPAEVAEALRVTPETIRRKIVSGELSALEVGGQTRKQYRITASDLTAWLGLERAQELFSLGSGLRALEAAYALLSEEETERLIAQAASALFRITRRFGRPFKGLLADEQGKGIELSRIMVAQTIHQLDQEEATVGKVAEELNVDPSTASRLIADTIRDGYAIRQPSQQDGRRAVLKLTSQGVKLAEEATAFQVQVMQHAMQGWSQEERQEFSRLFLRFSEALSNAVEV